MTGNKVDHLVSEAESEISTLILDGEEGFFPGVETRFKLLVSGNLIECMLKKVDCTCKRCPDSGKRHEHIILECPGLSNLIDIQKGNRLVFSRHGSLYVIEEAVYFTKR